MQFLSLQPFIPSGKDFEASRLLFQELGFNIRWENGDYIGFEKDQAKFILQKYDNAAFAENLMISVGINSADEFVRNITEKSLAEKFGIRVGKLKVQPYGKEIIVVDIAGVCWHFVE